MQNTFKNCQNSGNTFNGYTRSIGVKNPIAARPIVTCHCEILGGLDGCKIYHCECSNGTGWGVALCPNGTGVWPE